MISAISLSASSVAFSSSRVSCKSETASSRPSSSAHAISVPYQELGERKLARVDLEHVADRDLVHEILRRWRAGGRRGLGESKAKSPHPAAIIRALFMSTPWARRLDAAWPSNVGVHRWFHGLPESLGSADCSAAELGSERSSHLHKPGRTVPVCRLPDRRLMAARGT
jgi:hypothetical protein